MRQEVKTDKRRNSGDIEMMLGAYPHATPLPLPNWLLRRYRVLPHLFEQQYKIHITHVRRCGDRTVSISQPNIRPIFQGKQATWPPAED